MHNECSRKYDNVFNVCINCVVPLGNLIGIILYVAKFSKDELIWSVTPESKI